MKNFIFFSVLMLIFASCKDDKIEEPIPEVSFLEVTLQPMFGTAILNLDQTYTTSEGYDVQFTDIKCYFTSVKNGASELCRSALFDYRESGIFVFKKQGSPENFSSLNSKLGVDALYNHSDPTAFDNSDPLNISNANDMFWGWNPGYIFLKIEAKVDTINDGIANFDHFVNFHIGKDSFIQEFTFTSINWMASSSNKYSFPMVIDLQKFLQNGSQTIDLKTEFTSHSASGQDAISIKVIQNFKDALSKY